MPKTVGVAVSNATFHFDKLYTYAVMPDQQEAVRLGSMVLVPFGRGSRARMGVVLACDEEPEHAKLKYLFDVAPASACLTPELLRLFIQRIEVGERTEKYSRSSHQSIRIVYRDIGTVDSAMEQGEAQPHIAPPLSEVFELPAYKKQRKKRKKADSKRCPPPCKIWCQLVSLRTLPVGYRTFWWGKVDSNHRSH